jgi:hypothetical protein
MIEFTERLAQTLTGEGVSAAARCQLYCKISTRRGVSHTRAFAKPQATPQFVSRRARASADMIPIPDCRSGNSQQPTVQYSTVQYCIARYSVVLHSVVLYSATTYTCYCWEESPYSTIASLFVLWLNSRVPTAAIPLHPL